MEEISCFLNMIVPLNHCQLCVQDMSNKVDIKNGLTGQFLDADLSKAAVQTLK